MGWETHSDCSLNQIHWLTMKNSSKVGFHQELEDISVGSQHSIIATTNGIFQSTLLYTHLKKSSVYRSKSQHNKKGYLGQVQCILHLFSADDRQSGPSTMPSASISPCISLLGEFYSQKIKAGCRAPWKKRVEGCSHVLQVPPAGLTEKEKRVS